MSDRTPETTVKDEMLATLYANMERKGTIVDEVRTLPQMPMFSFIDLNPTERCNRTCVFCPRVDDAAYPNQALDISLALVEKMASELASYAWHGIVNICGYGEPLLHRDIVGVVRTFSARRIHAEVTTNGDPLTVDLAGRLHAAGLKKLVISLYDGPQQHEHFRKIQTDANLPDGFFVLRDRWAGDAEDFGLMLTNRAGTLNLGRVNNNKACPCFYPSYSLTIDWNGDALLCVQDWNKKVKMGNANTQSLLEIWQGTRIAKYRRLLIDGKRGQLNPCGTCDAHGRRHGSAHAEAWTAWYRAQRPARAGGNE